MEGLLARLPGHSARPSAHLGQVPRPHVHCSSPFLPHCLRTLVSLGGGWLALGPPPLREHFLTEELWKRFTSDPLSNSGRMKLSLAYALVTMGAVRISAQLPMPPSSTSPGDPCRPAQRCLPLRRLPRRCGPVRLPLRQPTARRLLQNTRQPQKAHRLPQGRSSAQRASSLLASPASLSCRRIPIQPPSSPTAPTGCKLAWHNRRSLRSDLSLSSSHWRTQPPDLAFLFIAIGRG